MKVFAISDLHLAQSVEKPMDIFGGEWDGYFQKIEADWKSRVCDEDLVLLGGDISWGMRLDEAQADFDLISPFPGKKVVVRGNHDYWWSSLAKISARFSGFTFIQNNAVKFGKVVVAGSRGWSIPTAKSSEEDKKIYAHELLRLKMSLDAAKAKLTDDDVLIALLHFPPFEADFSDTEMTALLEEYGVNIATYGHLHGKGVRAVRKTQKNGVTYYLTSCDLIGNTLVEIL
jgi:predicted phosphohydrolase